jgi:3'5'-cyclic nucleotide phosphodiesterase
MIIIAADVCKFAREASCYVKWFEILFNDYFMQGAKEESVGLQPCILMDSKNCKKEKAEFSYMEIICRPTLLTLSFLANEKFKEILDLMEKNRKSLETKSEA